MRVEQSRRGGPGSTQAGFEPVDGQLRCRLEPTLARVEVFAPVITGAPKLQRAANLASADARAICPRLQRLEPRSPLVIEVARRRTSHFGTNSHAARSGSPAVGIRTSALLNTAASFPIILRRARPTSGRDPARPCGSGILGRMPPPCGAVPLARARFRGRSRSRADSRQPALA